MQHILSQKIEKGSVGMWWLGQGGFIFKAPDGTIVVIDPYLSNSVETEKKGAYKRMVPIPTQPHDIVANVVLCTHDHFDHADPDTLKQIKSACLAGPWSCCELFKNIGVPEERIIMFNRGYLIAVNGDHSGIAVKQLIR